MIPLLNLDVISFTKVHLEPTLDLLRPIFPKLVVNVFDFVLRSAYFSFEGEFYKQIEGVAMGSPLSLQTLWRLWKREP